MAHQELGMEMLKRVEEDLERDRCRRADAEDGRATDGDGAGAGETLRI